MMPYILSTFRDKAPSAHEEHKLPQHRPRPRVRLITLFSLAIALISCGTSQPRPVSRTEFVAKPPSPRPTSPADCDDDSVNTQSIDAAIKAAVRRKVPAQLLADCRDQIPTCDKTATPPQAYERSERCRVHLAPYRDVIIVHLLPASAHGTPSSIEIWVGSDGHTGHSTISASHWAVQGALTIVGKSGGYMHNHGGKPAQIASAEILAWNDSDTPISLTPTKVEWLWGDGAVPSTILAAMSPSWVSGNRVPPHQVRLPARAVAVPVSIGFPPQGAYMASSDRFAVRMTFLRDGQEVSVTAEQQVTRVTPLRTP